jgi:nitrite reductase (NO-forming)
MFPIVGGYPYNEIARDPNDVPPRALLDGETVTITAHEIEAFLAPEHNGIEWAKDGHDVKFRYFAFGGGHPGRDPAPKVPGPFIRLRDGNTVTIILENQGVEPHSIDFHAVVGKKGGAAELMVRPDGDKTSFTFTARNPGLYVYHCVGDGTPHGIAHHMNNGMFGLILVEPGNPKAGFNLRTKNAKEFYVFQQDIFVSAEHDEHGEMSGGMDGMDEDHVARDFDEEKMLNTLVPDYSVFNGRVGALIDLPMEAKTGKNAVVYFASSGAHIPSPHMIGEIFDWVYDQGGILQSPQRNIQTALVPSAGSAVLIMDGDQLVPTNEAEGDLNILVDHALPYFRKGAIGLMKVTQ